ncbi:hypothetical protein MSAN_00135100 [Mycena sanguinolenta]|uniref:Uncharacterized protein n=1 Tax=Mycena sanguinolenta TaxID=230812 RepID=A0A8H6ZGM2_9AGAR|nr:hypothetical protein MSAN_00135100 [Mycena sanguinolenta]
MPTKKKLAQARAKAAQKAQAVSKLQAALRQPSPPYSSVDTSHSHLDFPESDTPMAPPSDTEEAVAPTGRQTRSRKRTVSEISESETSDAPVDKPVKKKSGPKPKSRPVKSVVPPKQPKKTPAPTASSDSDTSLAEPVTKPKKKKKKKQAIDSDGIEVALTVEMIFMIPEATSDGNQRVALDSSQSFEDAVEIMHETIGCVSVARKPTLAYKLSSAVQKAPTVNLRTAKDWDGLISDYTKKVKSKKDLSVVITVLPENYMFSLRGMNKKAPAIKKGVKKGKMTIIDLDNEDTDGDAEGDEGIEDAEKTAMADLDAAYRTVGHGPLAWQACGTNKVTKLTPPEGGLFHMFHGNNSNDGPPASAQPSYPHSQWHQLPPMQPGGYAVPGYPGYLQAPLFPHPPPTPARQPMMSSDPIEPDGIIYPSVIDFIETLITKAPQRIALRGVGETLDSLHFFEINEITSLTTQELGTEKFGSVVLGDAQYLLKQVQSEVKRLEKQARRGRH